MRNGGYKLFFQPSDSKRFSLDSEEEIGTEEEESDYEEPKNMNGSPVSSSHCLYLCSNKLALHL